MAWCWGGGKQCGNYSDRSLPYSYITFFLDFLLTLIPKAFLSILLGKHIVLT